MPVGDLGADDLLDICLGEIAAASFGSAESDRTAPMAPALMSKVSMASALSMAPRAERSPEMALRARVFIAADNATRKRSRSGTDSSMASMASMGIVADRPRRHLEGRAMSRATSRRYLTV